MLDKSGSHLNEKFPQKSDNLNDEQSNGFIYQNGKVKNHGNSEHAVSFNYFYRTKIFFVTPEINESMSADVLLYVLNICIYILHVI